MSSSLLYPLFFNFIFFSNTQKPQPQQTGLQHPPPPAPHTRAWGTSTPRQRGRHSWPSAHRMDSDRKKNKTKKKRGRKQLPVYTVLHSAQLPLKSKEVAVTSRQRRLLSLAGLWGSPDTGRTFQKLSHLRPWGAAPQPSSYKMEYSYLAPREALPHGGDTHWPAGPRGAFIPSGERGRTGDSPQLRGSAGPTAVPRLPAEGRGVKGFGTNPPLSLLSPRSQIFSSGNDCLHTQVRGAERCSPAALCFSISGRPCSCQGGHLRPFSCHLTQNPTNCSCEEHFGRRFPAGVSIATANVFAQALWWYFSVAKVLLFEFPIALDEYLPNEEASLFWGMGCCLCCHIASLDTKLTSSEYQPSWPKIQVRKKACFTPFSIQACSSTSPQSTCRGDW